MAMKIEKKYLLKIILFTAYIIFSHRITIFGCPTYISYSDDNSPPFFEEQEIETENNKSNDTQSEQIVSASITDDQENKQ